ncbi:MAG: pentapeptide repeat-containing protein [Dehalococcoidia bacterium]|jgi:hypothetical protein
MKTYTINEMKAILAEHEKWLKGEGGSRANLTDANLTGADLTGANLTGANLRGADLTDANLTGADLTDANLRGADLTDANLTGADLTDANLTDANLTRADLTGANLTGAKNLPHFQVPGGDLIVWKKVDGRVVRLLIPKEAKRTASIVGRKCRAEYAVVLETDDHQAHTSTPAMNMAGITYAEGETVRPDSYDDDWRIECSHGIHFFATREEAEEYNA